MIVQNLVRFLLTLAILSGVGIGLFDYLKNFDENECSMTWMYQAPKLLDVSMPIDGQNPFERYKLSLYCVGDGCVSAFNFKRGHIQSLVVPGNADSAMQVRSLASVTTDKSRYSKQHSSVRFHFFTISFNRELTGLYGPFVHVQTKYVQHAINHILMLFRKSINEPEKAPQSVLLIGNSLG